MTARFVQRMFQGAATTLLMALSMTPLASMGADAPSAKDPCAAGVVCASQPPGPVLTQAGGEHPPACTRACQAEMTRCVRDRTHPGWPWTAWCREQYEICIERCIAT